MRSTPGPSSGAAQPADPPLALGESWRHVEKRRRAVTPRAELKSRPEARQRRSKKPIVSRGAAQGTGAGPW